MTAASSKQRTERRRVTAGAHPRDRHSERSAAHVLSSSIARRSARCARSALAAANAASPEGLRRAASSAATSCARADRSCSVTTLFQMSSIRSMTNLDVNANTQNSHEHNNARRIPTREPTNHSAARPMTTQPQFQVITITGRLTRDPELGSLPSGDAVCKLRLAVDEMVGRGETGYIDVASYGASGEAAAKVLTKGYLIAVDGRMRYRTWEHDGHKRHALRRDRPRRVPRRPEGRREQQRQRRHRHRRGSHRRGARRGPRRGGDRVLITAAGGTPSTGVPPHGRRNHGERHATAHHHNFPAGSLEPADRPPSPAPPGRARRRRRRRQRPAAADPRVKRAVPELPRVDRPALEPRLRAAATRSTAQLWPTGHTRP